MNRARLSKLLYELAVPPDMYRLDGTHFELAYSIEFKHGKWIVFLSERGGESDPTEFESEHVACTYFFGCIAIELFERGILTLEGKGDGHQKKRGN